MGSLIKVARVAGKSIKPSSPTSPHLKTFKLSLLDQLAPSVYNPMVFFYPMDPTHDPQYEAAVRSQHLQNSLSPFLTRFYPFAGRIKDHLSINCNDAGVDFLEAKVSARMEDVLKRPDPHVLKHFLPVDIESAHAMGSGSQPLVHVQSNMFECGGLVLGVCLSHKITDGGTVSTFMKGWSSVASGSGNEVIPNYAASSLFPPANSSITQHALKLETFRTTTKRFVFDGSKIMELKARAATSEVPRPTRVEVVSSLLWKCATRASRSSSGSQPLSIMSQSMNIRRRTSPPLPDTTIGNLVGYYIAKMEENNDNMTLASLVAKQRQGKVEVTNNYARKLQGENAHLVIRELFNEARSLLRRDNVDFFKCFSTCGDGLYDADFGWGSPTWQSLVSLGYKNTFALGQTRNGSGIEAWVTLKEDVMARFERDLELLAFGSCNPSALELA